MSRIARIAALIVVLCVLLSSTIVSAAKPMAKQDYVNLVRTQFKSDYQRMAPSSNPEVTINANQDEATIMFEVQTGQKAKVNYNHLVMFHVSKGRIDQAAEYERTADGLVAINLLDNTQSVLKEGKDVPTLKPLPQPTVAGYVAPRTLPLKSGTTPAKSGTIDPTVTPVGQCQYCSHYTDVPGHWETSLVTIFLPAGCAFVPIPGSGQALCMATVTAITSWVPGYTYCDTWSWGECPTA